MTPKALKIRFRVLSLIVVGLFATRFLPLPPNFSPIFAIALFGGAYFHNQRAAYGVPILTMIFSDIILYSASGTGYPQPITFVVYGCILITVLFGKYLRKSASLTKVAGLSLMSSVHFFLVSNFFVWLGDLYPHTYPGLLTCYAAALPYFKYTVLSGLLFSGLLFGGYHFLERWYPHIFKISVKA